MRSIVSGMAGMFATVLLVLGCADVPKPGQLVPTKHAVRELATEFAEDLRWARYEAAALLVHPEQRPTFRNWVRRNGARLKVTSYEVDRVERGETIDGVVAHVSFTLYRLPHVEERTVTSAQRWRFDSGWYLEPDLAVFSGKESSQVESDPDRVYDGLGAYSDR